MAFDAKNLFQMLGSDDDEKAANLKKLLSGAQTAGISVGDPVIQPDAPLQPLPQPLTPVPTQPDAQPSAPTRFQQFSQQYGGSPAPQVTTPPDTRFQQFSPQYGGPLPAAAMNDNPPAPAPVATPAPAPAAAPQVPASALNDNPEVATPGMASDNPDSPIVPAGSTTGLDEVGWGTPAGYTAPTPSTPSYLQPLPANATSADYAQKIQDVEGNYQDPHKHSLLGRLFKGMGQAWKEAGPNTSLLGLLGGMGGAGIGSAVSPNYYSDMEKSDLENKLFKRMTLAQQQETFQGKQALTSAQRDYYLGRNPIAQNRIDEQSTHNQLIDTAKKRSDLMRMYNALPEFDPSDPDNAQMVAALKDAGLPALPKTAATKYKYITDAGTGKVYVDQSDKAGNRSLTQLTNDDGSDLQVTTPQMMTADEKKQQNDLRERLAKQGNVTRVKVAQIYAGSRENVANINQQGSNARNLVNSSQKAAQVLAAIDNGPPLKGEKPEQTAIRKQQARANFIKSLDPEIQKQFPQ